jgi:UDP-glucuronate 4-epimerase
MNILVTGAAGFIGAAVCQALLQRGDSVTGIDNLSDYYDVSLKRRVWKPLWEWQAL